MLKYELPLSEIVVDFYDQVKSISSGYARFVVWQSLPLYVFLLLLFLFNLRTPFLQ